MQKILVCDDDKQIVEAIDIYLTGEGFQVIKAYDGLEALELLKTNEVNLMIVDVMMPGLDGIRTTLKVRETSSIPIIILSAKSEDSDKILGLRSHPLYLLHSEEEHRNHLFPWKCWKLPRFRQERISGRLLLYRRTLGRPGQPRRWPGDGKSRSAGHFWPRRDSV